MVFQFKNIVPEPLLNRDLTQSDLWAKNTIIDGTANVHICAPSGTGKTSLLSILYGLRFDFSGEWTLDSVWSSDIDWVQVRQNEMAFVFQDLKLLENETALSNVVLKNQLTSALSETEIWNAAEQLGVQQLLEKPVGKLSRGERQRIAIIRSLCMPFKCILLDEPFSHLDEENSLKAAALIQQYATKNNAGILMANLKHDHYFQYEQTLNL